MRLYEYFKNCAVIIKQSFLEPIFLALSCATVEAMDDKWYPTQNVWGKDCEMVVAMYVIYHGRQSPARTLSQQPHSDPLPWIMAYGLGTLTVPTGGCLRAKILSLNFLIIWKLSLRRSLRKTKI